MSRGPLIYLVVVVGIGCVGYLAGCSQEALNQRDAIFANVIATGVTLNDDLTLMTGNSQYYTQHGWVDIFVINQTGHNLCFEDDAFGVRGFVFNEEQNQWEEIDLGFTPGYLGIRCLTSGATGLSETSTSFPTRWMDTKGYSEIRLLVIGYAAELVGGTPVGKKYGAYADIRIVEGGTVVPTPTAIVITPFSTP